MSDGPSTRPSLLIRLRNASDNQSWQDFVALYYPLIFRWCQSKGLQHNLAEEVAQEVLYRVSQAIRSFEYDQSKGKMRSWLFTITRREVVRFLKSENRIGERVGGELKEATLRNIETSTDDSEWNEQFNNHIYQTALARIRSEFDSLSWRVFEMIWIENQSPSETSAALEKEPAWVYKTKFRIMKRLKEEVLFLTEDSIVATGGRALA